MSMTIAKEGMSSEKRFSWPGITTVALLFSLFILLPSKAVLADEDDLADKVESSAEKIKELIDKYKAAEVNIVKREIVSIRDTRGNPRDCDVAIFYGNGQQARLTTKDGEFDGNFDHHHNNKVPSKALSIRLSNCECRPIKTKHQVTWLGINEELEKIKEVLKEEIEEAGKEKAKEYAEKVIEKLAEKVGEGFAAGASSFLSGFKAGADLGAPVGEYITDNINKILDAAVEQNIQAAELNDNAPLRPSVGHASLRGRWGNTFGANPQLQNKWDITVRCGNNVIPPSRASWSSVDDLVRIEYQQSPEGRAQAAADAKARADAAAAKAEQREAERAEREAEARRQAEERRREAERRRREAEQKRRYEERQRQLRAKAQEIARTCTICDPIRNDIKETEDKLEKAKGEIPGLEQAVDDAGKQSDQAKKKVQQAAEKLSNFRNPSSSVTDVESGRTVDSTDIEVKKQAAIEAMERYQAGEQSAQETSEQWEDLSDPDVIKDLKDKAEKRLEAELDAEKEKSRQADEALGQARRDLNSKKRQIEELERLLKELRAKLEECLKKCKEYAMDIARGRYTSVDDLMNYTILHPVEQGGGTTQATGSTGTPKPGDEAAADTSAVTQAGDETSNVKPVAMNVSCVGNGCQESGVDGNCLGDACNTAVQLNCSGSACIEAMDVICLGNSCPNLFDFKCDIGSCETSADFFCDKGQCTRVAGGDGGFISSFTSSTPYEFPIRCSGAGCDAEFISGLCFGDNCPETGELNCPGTGCTDAIELNCSGSFCSNEFNYDCYGDSCSAFLQLDCSGASCDQREGIPPAQPYLTGAAGSGPSALVSGSGTPSTGSAPQVEPVVTPRGSSETIPASNADIDILKTAAERISRNAGACLDAECPKIDCATAASLLQGLINAEANLDEMYRWLIQASDDAMAHLLSLNANDILTAEQLAQAQDAQALHKYLHDIGSLLLDLASLGEAVEKIKKGEFADSSSLKQLDDTYETLKDLESAVGTIGGAYDVNTPAPVSNAPGHVIGALGGDAIADSVGAPNATPEAIGSAINDIKSQINDAISIVEDAREGKSPAAAVGKAIGRILKTVSAGKMQERQRLIDEYIRNIGANAGVIASSMDFLQKTNNRRFAVEDALKAVRAAKSSLMACMAKACGAISLSRPSVNSGFNGWGEALRHFNASTAGLFNGLDGSFKVEDHCPGAETAISLFAGDGMGSGSTSTIGSDITLVPSHSVQAKCPACQPYADTLAANLSETDFWRAEKAEIEQKIEQAKTLRERLAILEKRKANNRKSLQKLNTAYGNAEAFGFNWGPRLATMRREAEARGRDLQRQIQEMNREIERLETRKPELETIDERLDDLRDERRDLRADLRYCEQEHCGSYDADSAAVGRFFGEIFSDVEIIDVKNISGNKPYDTRDPVSGGNLVSTGGSTTGTGGGVTTGGGNTGGSNTGGNGGTGGGDPTPDPIMVNLSPSSILDRHVVGNSPCNDPMGSVNIELASFNNFTVTDIQVNGAINGFVEASSPGGMNPLSSQSIDFEFNCASAATTIRNGDVTATVTDSVTGQTDTITIQVTNEVTQLIDVLPSGATFIPISKLILAGPEPVVGPNGCANNHFHGGPAVACDGSIVNDPLPAACGYGIDTDVIPFEELDCDNP